MLLAVPLHQQRIRAVLAHGHWFAGDDVKQQVERGFSCFCVHLIFKDARKSPILRIFRGHSLDFGRDAVRYFPDEAQELRVRVFVTFVLWDVLF